MNKVLLLFVVVEAKEVVELDDEAQEANEVIESADEAQDEADEAVESDVV